MDLEGFVMSGKYLRSRAAEWISRIPAVYPCGTLHEEGLRGIFYEGINGTRIFAWIGIPEKASAETPVPGIVLVHGGLGTAYANWARYWKNQGFAAIAMDTCGAMPSAGEKKKEDPWPRHQWSGAPGWGAWDQYDKAPEDQWFTHAVSAVMLAHNLLRSFPEVDPGRIGITGVSWGAVLTLISIGLDHRYKAACPVYGNGFLWESPGNIKYKQLKEHSEAGFEWWIREWDPSNFLKDIRCPVLWYASTNDNSIFYPREWQKSVSAVPQSELCMKLRWIHSHGKYSEEQPEIRAFFRQYLESGEKRLRISRPELRNGELTAVLTGKDPLAVFLTFTCDTDRNWFDRQWHVLPAEYNSPQVRAVLPEGWQGAFFTVLTQDLQDVTSMLVFSGDSDE